MPSTEEILVEKKPEVIANTEFAAFLKDVPPELRPICKELRSRSVRNRARDAGWGVLPAWSWSNGNTMVFNST